MGRIRRWFRGTLRPDALETDTVTTDLGVIGTLEDKSSGNQYDPDSLAGGGGVWTKDGDLSVSDGTSAVYNPSTTYDQYLILVHEWFGHASTLTNWTIIANGDSSSTDTILEDDTRSANSAKVFRKDPTTDSLSGAILSRGRWADAWSAKLMLSGDTAPQGLATQIADTTLTSPLDSIEFSFADGQNVTVEADILGRDIA